MVNLSGPRCLAIVVAGAAFGWWVALEEPAKLAYYAVGLLTRFFDAIWLRIGPPGQPPARTRAGSDSSSHE